MAFDIIHRITNAVLYHSETARNKSEAVREALGLKVKPNLRYANLRSADLSFSNLSSADLSSADLRSADLSFSNLSFSDLRFADLSFSNLSSANLSYANLSFSNLSSANLSSADLDSANLSYANLRFAGCIAIQIGEWSVLVTPDLCSVGCQKHPHEIWLHATPESVSQWHSNAAEWWQQWGEIIKAACVACAKHGWPVKKEAEVKAEAVQFASENL